MKCSLALLLALLLLTGCGAAPVATVTPSETATEPETVVLTPVETTPGPEYVSRFDSVTEVGLSDTGITVDGGGETDWVYTSHDILYYEDRDAYESGNPYGEGTDADKHTAEEAAAHTVVNITAPGAYRVSGKLSAGQIRVDLGEAAYEDPNAVVELILCDTDITCTVAPAVLFLNTYECDGGWAVETAKPDVDTSAAGASLILEGKNTVSGSHVAKIFKDKEGEKKLWKQDGAVYSYMSLNVFGPGSLDLNADNEGLDTELHLTINGGSIAIRSDNDGINTNEDGVSVTTINGGSLHIIAGLGAEGDGIDSNGYLVINGGTVVSSANPAADAGLDSDLGSFIHGGTVIALGSTMDWAESDSDQVTMNLQFAGYQSGGSAIVVKKGDTVIFAYDPSEDDFLAGNARQYMGAILSCPYFTQGDAYEVYLDGTVTGSDAGGVYDVSTITGYTGGVQQAYTGNDVGRGFGGGRGGFGFGQRPEGDFDKGERPEMPEGEMPTMPEGMEPPQGMEFPEGERPEMPDGARPEGGTFPDGERPEMPDGTRPEGGAFPDGERPEMSEGQQPPEGGFPGREGGGMSNLDFYMNDKVNSFSGVGQADG